MMIVFYAHITFFIDNHIRKYLFPYVNSFDKHPSEGLKRM